MCFFSEEAGVRGCEEGVRIGGWLAGGTGRVLDGLLLRAAFARCREISDGILAGGPVRSAPVARRVEGVSSCYCQDIWKAYFRFPRSIDIGVILSPRRRLFTCMDFEHFVSWPE